MSILGMWMWPENVRIYGAEKVISHCARAKVTDLYFLTKGLAGTVSFRSALAPGDNDRDLLGELITAAHAAGIRVHAWFTSASDEHYKHLHPESGRYHFINGKDKGHISLADEGYLSYMSDITRELCRGYDIDGLHLDYIRYNHLIYGWSEEDLRRYAAEGADTGRLKDMMHRMYCAPEREETLLFDAYNAGDESALALTRARRKDVVRFARLLTDTARAEKSNLILSAALMPEGAYDNIAFSDVHYGQNYADASEIYDYALPMAYSKAYEKDGAWVKMVAEGTIRRDMKTIMGLHAYDGGTGLSLKEDIKALEGTSIEGICLFREGATALAYARENEISVYNPLRECISRIVVHGKNGERAEFTEALQPGEETRFPLSFEADAVQVFADSGERSVYLAQER
ncbi:MAG: family 10 glycosylhydrolase [Clostridia bacterium]|nr:family 10 glycosylhydrolase [Clostridia bacterium]